MAAVAVAASLISACALAQDTSDAALLAARYTARAAFLVFIPVYIAGPVATLWPGSDAACVVSHRRALGIAFAVATAVHLAALSVNIGIYRPRSLSAILPGSLVFALAFAMAATANSGAREKLGVWWKRLHVIGLNAILIGFANGYVGRLGRPGYAVAGAIGTAILVVMVALRIAAFIRRRRHQPFMAG